MTHSTHFMYSYMPSDIDERISYNERGDLLPSLDGPLSPFNSKGSFICTIPQGSTYHVRIRNSSGGPLTGIDLITHHTIPNHKCSSVDCN